MENKGTARILVVDDDFTLREFMEIVLCSSGYICACAVDGLDATHRLATDTFDMVISDIEMPRLDGFELLTHVKENYPQIKIILISGKHMPEDTLDGLASKEAHYFLAKPFPVQHFLATVQMILHQS